jgi:putative flavoprotein involved in K+ transport
MTMGEVIDFIERFAIASNAPIRTGTNVTSVRRTDDGYVVITSGGEIRCRSVVIASGACNRPTVPPSGGGAGIGRSADTLRLPQSCSTPAGGVRGSSASASLAPASGRSSRCTLRSSSSVSRETSRRRTRASDSRFRSGFIAAKDQLGIAVWDERYDQVEDLERARRLPSPQLVGTSERTTLDLNALADLGVEMVGRWAAVRDGRALFSGGLRNMFSLADLKLERLLNSFDDWARSTRSEDIVEPPARCAPTRVATSARWQLDLRSGEICTIIWATGFRPDYGWLDVPVVDVKGRLRHDGGTVESPGMYALGLPVLRRRKSTFIHGIEADAHDVVAHLSGYLAGTPWSTGGLRHTAQSSQ